MADLDTLRPEVREAWNRIVADEQHPEDFECVEAELLRLDALARELNEERGRQAALRFDERIRAEKAEAELAALKALLRECEPIISAYAESLHLTDGFRRRPHECDGLAEQVRAAVKVEE